MNLLLEKSNAHSRQKSDMNQMCRKLLTSGIGHCEWKLSHPVVSVLGERMKRLRIWEPKEYSERPRWMKHVCEESVHVCMRRVCLCVMRLCMCAWESLHICVRKVCMCVWGELHMCERVCKESVHVCEESVHVCVRRVCMSVRGECAQVSEESVHVCKESVHKCVCLCM